MYNRNIEIENNVYIKIYILNFIEAFSNNKYLNISKILPKLLKFLKDATKMNLKVSMLSEITQKEYIIHDFKNANILNSH